MIAPNPSPDWLPILATRPELIFNVRPIKVVQHDDEVLVQGRRRNPSHYFLGTEEEFYSRAPYVLDYVKDILAFDDLDAWRHQSRFFQPLLQQFFTSDSDAPAWVSVVTSRVPFESRFQPQFSWDHNFAPKEDLLPPAGLVDTVNLYRYKLDLGYGIGKIPLNSLLMGYPSNVVTESPCLIRQLRCRTVMNSRYPEASDLIFYLADRQIDKELAEGGIVPAMRRFYDEDRKLLTTVSVTLAKMNRSRPSDITQLILTFHPDDGWTAALASGRRSLKVFCIQYLLEHELLLTAIHQ